MRTLRIEQEGQPPLVFDGSLVTIGRSASNLLVVRDARISSVHGEIVRRGPEFFYRDLGSTNGSMVRSEGETVVVDGTRVREMRVGDGDALLLGDRNDPVALLVYVDVATEGAEEGRTIVARRSVESVDVLGTQVVDNPLASRQTLSRLFGFYGDLCHVRSARSLSEATAAFALGLLSKNLFAAVFTADEDGFKRTALVARDAAHTPALESGDVSLWFPDVMAGKAAMAITASKALRTRHRTLKTIAAAPFPSEEHNLGVLVVGRSAEFSEFDLDLLSLTAHHAALQLQRVRLIGALEVANATLSSENRDLRDQLSESVVERPIIGESPLLKRTLKQADLVAKTGTTVLILGETGTGKELLALYIHNRSDRAGLRFAAVNCGALAETLLESELFGHVRGAFTGAATDKKGLFQEADGGTLFLDEIGDVSSALQVKLLRVLEAREVTPVGSTQPIKVDVRIIGATHRDLDKMVAEGTFREDLLYRINVFPVALPPLRKRPGDVPTLTDHFVEIYTARLGKQVSGLHRDTVKALKAYHWPGNIRELQNEIHRAVLMADEGEQITPEALSDRVVNPQDAPRMHGTLREVLGRLEEQYIRRVLKEHGNNRTQSAKSLGISRQALTEKLRKYKIGPRYADTAHS